MNDAKERYERLSELFEEARRLASGERAAFLRSRCPEDPRLVEEVLDLVARYEDSSGPLPAWDSNAEWTREWSEVLERLRRHRPRESRYRMDGELDKGGQGVVYRVWDEDLGRPLAMKVTLGQVVEAATGQTPPLDSRTLGRFLDEARITGQLDHPGIVPVHELGIDPEGRVYFTMRLVQGRDFHRIIQLAREGREGWTPTRALHVLLRVCEAMAYAHSRDVIHRDLKPQNVLVGRFGETYVMDWGLGRVLGREDVKDIRLERPPAAADAEGDASESDDALRTKDGDVIGTPAYMAPEQARGELDAVGPRSDVYSIGAILYHLLAGAPPYQRPGAPPVRPSLVLDALLAGPPPPVAALDREAPEELVAICEKAMAREAGDRFGGVGELADDLRAYLEIRVVRSHRTGPVIELRKWVRRNPGVAAALAALVLVVASAGFVVAAGEANRRAAVERSRDERSIASLFAELDELSPIHPDTVPAMERWLAEAHRLQAKLPELHDELAALERELAGAQRVQLPPSREVDEREQRLRILRNFVDGFADLLVQKREEVGRATEPDRVAELEREIEIIEGEDEPLATEIAQVEAELLRYREWRFADPAHEARYAALFDLVRGIESLAAQPAALATVEARLEAARTLPARSLEGEHALAWQRAIASIADPARSPRYEGLRIEPQIGLVPLRQDPDSGLWEFWHVLSGERPELRPDDRRIVASDTGIVLVLIPATRFWMGAQSTDAAAPNYVDLTTFRFVPQLDPEELPVHQVAIDAYFISKYELTQAQWWRATGRSPSVHFAGADYLGDARIARTHPVDHVSFRDANAALALWNLEVPTEAQWECAARAGSSDPFVHPVTLAGFANGVNFADKSIERRRTIRSDPVDLDDSYSVHAPVDAFPANGFGLSSIVGNVSEWCRDWSDRSGYDLEDIDPGSGEHRATYSKTKAIRGGSFASSRADLRVSHRVTRVPFASHQDVGVRPARALIQ